MDIDNLFTAFEDYAFRLEALGNYVSPNGPGPIELFKRGEKLSAGFNADWVDTISAARGRGARMERLRLVTDPATLYERFELEAAYQPGVEAGEDIRVALRSNYPIQQDFWAFDDQWISLMNYDENGAYLNSEVLPMTDDHRALVRYWKNIHQQEATVVSFQ